MTLVAAMNCRASRAMDVACNTGHRKSSTADVAKALQTSATPTADALQVTDTQAKVLESRHPACGARPQRGSRGHVMRDDRTPLRAVGLSISAWNSSRAPEQPTMDVASRIDGDGWLHGAAQHSWRGMGTRQPQRACHDRHQTRAWLPHRMGGGTPISPVGRGNVPRVAAKHQALVRPQPGGTGPCRVSGSGRRSDVPVRSAPSAWGHAA